MKSDLAQSKLSEVLEICKSLEFQKGKRSDSVYKALEKLCELYKIAGTQISDVRFSHISEIDLALRLLQEYAVSVDNWKVEGCLFGLKDQCAILSYLLDKNNFKGLSGNLKSSQQVYQLLRDWKDLDIEHLY